MQAALDDAVADGSVGGGLGGGHCHRHRVPGREPQASTTAGEELADDPRLPTASVAKTLMAAHVMQLVEQGRLGLDDSAVDHLPTRLGRDDLNGATIRDLLGMRSGLTDPVELRRAFEATAGTSWARRRYRKPALRTAGRGRRVRQRQLLPAWT